MSPAGIIHAGIALGAASGGSSAVVGLLLADASGACGSSSGFNAMPAVTSLDAIS
jgi:hypothetical protein